MGKSAIGKALGYPGLDSAKGPDLDDEPSDGMPDSEPMPDEGKPDEGGNPAEVLAMKQFERASTPEAKASALKSFLEACGAISGSDESY